MENLNLDYNKRRLIKRALVKTNGSITKASSLLKVSRKTAYNLITRYSINISEFKTNNNDKFRKITKG